MDATEQLGKMIGEAHSLSKQNSGHIGTLIKLTADIATALELLDNRIAHLERRLEVPS